MKGEDDLCFVRTIQAIRFYYTFDNINFAKDIKVPRKIKGQKLNLIGYNDYNFLSNIDVVIFGKDKIPIGSNKIGKLNIDKNNDPFAASL